MKAGAFLAVVSLATLASGAEDAPLEVLHVHGNVYMLAGAPGNITVQAGKDAGHAGVLLVDTGSAPMKESLAAQVRKLSGDPVRFIINTSADADHIGNNASLAKPGVGLFAHAAVLARMSAKDTGVATAAWPTITFDDRKDFDFNGEAIQIFSEKGAHTDGDSIVFFRGSNVVSAGDIFLTTGYPVIDLKHGGSIQGEIKALNHILELTVPHAMQEGGTMVVPGHGRLCDEADVSDYRDMMTIIRDRVADLIRKGKSLDEVKAARPTRDYDRRYSTASWTGEMLTEAVYQSLRSDKE
jgi:cyclase